MVIVYCLDIRAKYMPFVTVGINS